MLEGKPSEKNLSTKTLILVPIFYSKLDDSFSFGGDSKDTKADFKTGEFC